MPLTWEVGLAIRQCIYILFMYILVCFVAKGWAGGMTISQPAYGFFTDLVYIMKQGLAPVEWEPMVGNSI